LDRLLVCHYFPRARARVDWYIAPKSFDKKEQLWPT
jgi:hypothetical protein